MLLISYLWSPEESVLDYLIEIVDIVSLRELPPSDLAQIKADWDTVVNKVRAGLAHELSCSDTLYLEACTKGSKSSPSRKQPYSTELAKPRAWALKSSFMTALSARIFEKMEAIARAEDEKDLTLIELVRHRFEPYFGMTEDELGIGEFYAAKMMPDALKGLFTKRVLLVGDPTEYFALPIYFQRSGFSLAKEGIEIVSCGGKGQMTAYYRLFNAFGVDCFCLFDADLNSGNNSELQALFGIESIQYDPDYFCIDQAYAYFGKDLETTLRQQVCGYAKYED